MYHDIPRAKLDAWWLETIVTLQADPGNWDAVRDQVLLENEYARRGWDKPRIQVAEPL